MCGIAGIYSLCKDPVPDLKRRLLFMNAKQEHRGPDGSGVWRSQDERCGLGHVRLSILDLELGSQPMIDEEAGLSISFNGEIYNFRELRTRLEDRYRFQTHSDTEVILKAYREWGEDCVDHLRGMFAFGIHDHRNRKLFLARDRFGIKPLYYAQANGCFYFASEVKALLPFFEQPQICREGLRDYFTFQFCLLGKTLFRDIREVPPASVCSVSQDGVRFRKYWRVNYEVDWDHTDRWFRTRCLELMQDAVQAHVVSDVPVGAYVSGGIDSSGAAVLGRRITNDQDFMVFHGRFDYGNAFDESQYAKAVAAEEGMNYQEAVITHQDFLDCFKKVIYHLDYPVAGPGSFPQYMVSRLVRGKRKVVLGGQGGDEIFGGYVRYLIAYLEQCLKGAIAGPVDPERFVVTYESIIPNLRSLQGYQPLMRHFFSKGMFEDYDRRYYQLIDRSSGLGDEICWRSLSSSYDPYESFREVYFSNEIGQRCYFDSMLHFDFVTLLPALLQVEDRMSMAHGVESRTPFLDHPLIEFAATIPADVKFKNGELKRLPKRAFRGILPSSVLNRKDKMGFPVPLVEWFQSELKEFVTDAFATPSAAGQEFLNYASIQKAVGQERSFGRKIWGYLCLDEFFKQFVDGHETYESAVRDTLEAVR